MTNEQLALLLDPRREKPGWWIPKCPRCGCAVFADKWTDSWYCNRERHRFNKCPKKFHYTGPDWHASDDACFRDWRPVLLAAGCEIVMCGSGTWVDCPERGFLNNISGGKETTYRAATLAAIEELHTTKPELLREAITRVEGGE